MLKLASIKKRGNYWQARVDYYDHNHKRHFKNKSGFATKREATIWATEKENELNVGNSITNSETPFDEYFWNWFEQFKEMNVTERTKLTYKQAYNALHNYLQDPIGDITRKRYREFLNEYGHKHAKSTVSKYNSLYHACVKEAIYDGDIHKDFIANVDLVFDKKKTRQVEYLNVEETKKLCQYIMETKNRHFTSKYMILLAIYTGARLGEIQALTWKDINFSFKTIEINKAWYETTKKFKDTKNESSKRFIRVNDEVLDILKELKENQKEMVFENQYGTIPSSAAVNKTLRECLRKIEINKRGFHFHSLRHTHVAYLLSEGIDIYAIAKRLGHSDITTTTRIYSYLIDEFKTRTDDLIASSLNKLNENNCAHYVHKTL